MMRNGIAARFAAGHSRTTVEPTRSQSTPDLATTLMRMASASAAAGVLMISPIASTPASAFVPNLFATLLFLSLKI